MKQSYFRISLVFINWPFRWSLVKLLDILKTQIYSYLLLIFLKHFLLCRGENDLKFLKSEPRINISQKLLIKILGASISFIRVHKNQEHLSRYIRDQNLTERRTKGYRKIFFFTPFTVKKILGYYITILFIMIK